MFQKLLLSSVAILGLTGLASAADMPMKAAPMVVAPYDWSGFYIGGVIGGGWSHSDSSEPGLGILGTLIGFPVVQTTTGSGFIGGIEGGDRYQFGKLVIGWEADMTWGNIGGTSNTAFGPSFVPPGVINFTRSINTSMNWTGTATSSVGIAHDRWLIYGKAGVAWANFSETDNSIVNVPIIPFSTPLFSGTGSQNRVGWTVGTGVEWAIWNSWSVKVEYDYLDFGNRTTQVNGTVLPSLGGGLPVSLGLQDTLHVQQVKAGLNWHIMPNIW
jgi:outer membrane immunogenic protein